MRGQRQRRAHQPRDAPLRPPPPPRPLGHLPPAPPLRGRRRAARCCGASSAATSPTCCAGCAASAPTTAPTPPSSSPRPPSASRPAWPRSCAGSPVQAVTDDGSPRGERLFALWNPPAVDEAAAGGRTSTGARHRRARGRPGRTAATAPSPSAAAARAPRWSPPTSGADCRSELADSVRPYRGGYLAAERREIEAELFGGRLRGVVATTALELGIDVGGLDACVLNGFPGTIASHVAAGRAGRARGRRPRSPCWWPATTSSTSGSCPTPTSCSPARPSRRWSTRPTPSCCSPTWPARPTSCP